MEFLRYPQLIPWFFNTNVVRASTASYRRFTLAMGRSPGFGSTADDSDALSDSLSLRLQAISP